MALCVWVRRMAKAAGRIAWMVCLLGILAGGTVAAQPAPADTEAELARLKAQVAEQARKIETLQVEVRRLQAQLEVANIKPARFHGPKGMAQTLPDFRVEKVPLEAVFERLKSETELNFLLDWKSLEALGVERQVPVTLQLRLASLGQILDAVCQPLGQGQIDWDYDEQATVTVGARATVTAHSVVVRTYDVRKLVTAGAPAGGAVRPAGGGGGLFSAGAEASPNDALRALQTTIERTVAPDTWQENGGTTGSISNQNSTLVVRTTRKTHAQVAELLANLEKK